MKQDKIKETQSRRENRKYNDIEETGNMMMERRKIPQ